MNKKTHLLRQEFLQIIESTDTEGFDLTDGTLADKLILAAEKFYKKSPKAPKEPKTITAYTGCIDAYNEFVIEKTSLPGKFDGAEGKAMKSIITYLSTITHVKTDEGTINSFKHILKLYDKWEPFHKNQLKLQQINSNLINIINAIKNGSSKKSTNNYEQSKYRADSSNATQPANI